MTERYAVNDRVVNLHEVPSLHVIAVRQGISLRPLDNADAESILDTLDRDPIIRNRVSAASKMMDLATFHEVVRTYSEDEGMIRYAITEHDEAIGLVSFWRDGPGSPSIEPHPDDYGFGYFLDQNHRGKGIVADSVRAVMEAATSVLTVRNFIAFCEDDNTGSIATLLRLGFEPTEETMAEKDNGWTERRYVKRVQPVATAEYGID